MRAMQKRQIDGRVRMTHLGHEGRFPAQRLNGRCGFESGPFLVAGWHIHSAGMSHENAYISSQHIVQEEHSMLQPTVCVDDDLTISIKRGANRLSPGEALSVAEKGIRTPTRRMILEEAPVITRQEMPAFRVYQKGPC